MADRNTDNIKTPKSKGVKWGLATAAFGGLAVTAFLASGAWAIIGMGLLGGAACSAYKTVKPNKKQVSVDVKNTIETGLSKHNSSPQKILKKSPEEKVQDDIEASQKAPHPLKAPEKPEAMDGPARSSTDWVDSIKKNNSPSAGIG